MNTLSSSCHTLFNWVWQASLAGAVVFVLIALIQLAARKWLPSRLAYLLWSCALLRLVLPFTPSSQFSVFNCLPRMEYSSDLHNPPGQPIMAPGNVPIPPTLSPVQETPLSDYLPAGTPFERSRSWPALPLLWLLGALSYFAIVFAKHRKLSLILSQQKPLQDPRLNDCILEGMHLFNLKHPATAYEVRRNQSPALFGFFRPKLLISKTVLDQLSDGELRLLVLHELAHVARRDVLLNWLLILVQAIHWFNPLVWLASSRWRAAREELCDARILSLLHAEERHTYGTMLLKLASICLKPTLPGLVPIFKTKKDIHRRITMITRFKPATRISVLASAIFISVIAVLTLTGAGKNPAAPPPATESRVLPASKSSRSSKERIDAFKMALELQQQHLQQSQAQLNDLRGKLRITEDDPKQQSENDSVLLRKLEALKVEANTEYVQLGTLVKQLESFSRAQLRKAISTINPDPQLSTLQLDYATTQQKLADLSSAFAPDHPDVKRLKSLLATIDGQINDRVDGILEGLKARAAAASTKLQNLESEFERASKAAIEKAVASRPYFDRKRQLESEMALRDRLQARLQEEQLNARLEGN